MNTEFVIALLVVVVASVYGQGYGGHGGGLELGGYGGGDEGHKHIQEYIDYRAPPKYHYNYAVHDSKHHDFKSQYEVRDGKEVKGRYELLQPDGRKRIVEYVAGKHGADYTIKYEGKAHLGGIGSYGGY